MINSITYVVLATLILPTTNKYWRDWFCFHNVFIKNRIIHFYFFSTMGRRWSWPLGRCGNTLNENDIKHSIVSYVMKVTICYWKWVKPQLKYGLNPYDWWGYLEMIQLFGILVNDIFYQYLTGHIGEFRTMFVNS